MWDGGRVFVIVLVVVVGGEVINTTRIHWGIRCCVPLLTRLELAFGVLRRPWVVTEA
jgi:hypothetical protein